MLTRVRIEVEEETAEACVEALWKYEHAIVQQEVRRYRHLWPIPSALTVEDVHPTPDQPWSDDNVARHWFNSALGREVSEEVIEYDDGLPGYRGRRVVRFARIDTRLSLFRDSLTPESVVRGLDDSPPVPTTRRPREGEYADPQPSSVTSD